MATIKPTVNETQEFIEIAFDFSNPLDLVREAISNAFDARANHMKIGFDAISDCGEKVLKIILDVKTGAGLDFTLEGKLNTFHATVYARESKIDPTTHTLTIRALYPNANGAVLPGRYASIKLNKDEIQDALAVPSEAIVPEMGKDKIFLYKSGKAQPVEITTGIRTEAEVQVLQGLQAGDTIITSGTLQLRTGLPVTLDNIN